MRPPMPLRSPRAAALLVFAVPLLLAADKPKRYKRADFDKEIEPFGLPSTEVKPDAFLDGTLVAAKVVRSCERMTGLHYRYTAVRCTLPDKDATDLVFFFGINDSGYSSLAWVDHGAAADAPLAMAAPSAWSEDFGWAFRGGHFDTLEHLAGLPPGRVTLHHYYSTDFYPDVRDVRMDTWNLLREPALGGDAAAGQARVEGLRALLAPASFAAYEAYVAATARLAAQPRPARQQFADFVAWLQAEQVTFANAGEVSDADMDARLQARVTGGAYDELPEPGVLPPAERGELLARYDLLRDAARLDAGKGGLEGAYAVNFATWFEHGTGLLIELEELGVRHNPLTLTTLAGLTEDLTEEAPGGAVPEIRDWPAARAWLLGLYDTNFYKRPGLVARALATYASVRPILLAEAGRAEREGRLATAAELYMADARLLPVPAAGEVSSEARAAALYERLVAETVPVVEGADTVARAWVETYGKGTTLARLRGAGFVVPRTAAQARAAGGEVWTATITEPRITSAVATTSTRTDEGTYTVAHTGTNADYEFWQRRRDAAAAAVAEIDALMGVNASTSDAGSYTADSSITDVYTHTDGSAPDVIRQGGGASGASYFHTSVTDAVNTALQERRRPLAARLAAIEAERPSETTTTREERRATYTRQEQYWLVSLSAELVARGPAGEQRRVYPENGRWSTTRVATSGQSALGIAAQDTFASEADIRAEAAASARASLASILGGWVDTRVRQRIDALTLPGVSAADLAEERKQRGMLLLDPRDAPVPEFELRKVPGF